MVSRFDIIVHSLYDSASGKLLTGGAERWCLDVARLARDHGFSVCIWQKSPHTFEKSIEDNISIRGVRAKRSAYGDIIMANKFERERNDRNPALFVSQLLLGFRRFRRSVAVNHGVWWGGDFPAWKRILNKPVQRKLIMNADATICVDTNYINWCHAELRGRREWQSRLRYVPNYADTDLFKPSEHKREIDSKSPTILFPRRVPGDSLDNDPRGAGLFLRAIEILESEGMRPHVVFVGRSRCLHREIAAWGVRRGMGERLKITEVPFNEMPNIYGQADVAVIPTTAYEGTSLSAIEAILSGMPVVATHIGGLGNILINGLNGYLSDLTPESLAAAIRKALVRPPLANAPCVLTACREALGKHRWDKQVWSILQDSLDL